MWALSSNQGDQIEKIKFFGGKDEEHIQTTGQRTAEQQDRLVFFQVKNEC
jgi:hypothetical protein